MAKINGTAIVGTVADPVVMAAAQAATWTHNQGNRAPFVQVFDANGNQLDNNNQAVITQPDVNTIVVTNNSGGGLSVKVLVTWKVGTIGLSEEIVGSDPSVVVA